MSETPEDVYRAAARTRATRERYHETLEPAEFERLVDHYALDPDLRDAVDLGIAAGREAAAQAILDHADKHYPRNDLVNSVRRTARRTLETAARVAAGPMTDAQMVEAIQRGDFAVCYLDEAGRPIGGETDG